VVHEFASAIGPCYHQGVRKIAILFLLAGAPFYARAQEDEFLDEFALLEDAAVVESAARHRQEIGMSPSAITVITREDIETTGASTLPDLMRIVPGMEVIYLGINAATPACRLHYTEGNFHFLVLIDGREANIELLGQTLWEALPISLEDVERIEIIRGPASG
jgi:outer membrane cobalamin receptor